MNGRDNRPHRANATSQRLCMWSGVVFMVFTSISLLGIARLFPPPLASDTAEQVRQMYIDHQGRIQLGLGIAMIGSGFLYPFAAGLAVQIERIEGRWSPLAMTSLASGLILGVLTFIPLMTMAAAAFRPETRSADVTQGLHDLGWLTFVGAGPSAFIWLLTVGIAVLGDPRARPIFPRWVGYLTIWCAFLNLPAITIIFFNHGPFSWHGIVGFYIPLVAFSAWFIVLIVYVLRAITEQEKEEEGLSDVSSSLTNFAVPPKSAGQGM